jgi:hypothetical protein
MPTTKLGYFRNLEESEYGTLRGLFAFIMLFISLTLFYLLTKKRLGWSTNKWYNKKWLRIGIISLVLCSALAVQLPKTYPETILYGMLVGFVVSVVSVSFMNKSFLFSAGIVAFMSTLCGLVSPATFFLSKKLNLYK